MAKKTDKQGGVIVNTSESSKKVKAVNFNGPPTKFVLRNMLWRGLMLGLGDKKIEQFEVGKTRGLILGKIYAKVRKKCEENTAF
ncbi:hypothetical protein ACS0TY_026155 [Phlomoides rotata]